MKKTVSLPLAALAGLTLAVGVAVAAGRPPAAAPQAADEVASATPPAPQAPVPPAPQAPPPSVVTLTPDQMAAAGLVVVAAERRALAVVQTVPGVVQANAYRSALVSTRLPAVVQSRHANLGDVVREGQPLATLFSAEMAEAQSAFVLADREWRRVESLGRDVVAGRRWAEADIGRQTARTRLISFGLSAAQVEALAREGGARSPGLFTLSAPRAGTVTADAFRVGEMVEPGRPLFEVVDTATVWVEARLSVATAAPPPVGAAARVRLGGQEATATLRQVLPTLDEQTRTLGLRFEVDNPRRLLTPGQFVEVEMTGTAAATAVVVPTGALTRDAEGKTSLFVEEAPGRFRAQPVAAGQAQDGLTTVEGVAPGTRVAAAGAFFLQSELARAAGQPR